MKLMTRNLLRVGLFAALVFPAGAPAQEGLKDKADNLIKFSDREYREQWERGKEELTSLLKSGEERDFYRRELEKADYAITSVNYDKADSFEYEVVKGDRTYEVQVDLDKNSQRASRVNVGTNLWPAETTNQIMKGKKQQVSKEESSDKDNTRYSDRDRKGQWEKGRNDLANALKTGQERDFYRRQLEKLGYTITSVNQDKADYVEYEVVKGDQTEVQVEIDKNTHKGARVDISTNMWKADATENALKSMGRGKTNKPGLEGN